LFVYIAKLAKEGVTPQRLERVFSHWGAVESVSIKGVYAWIVMWDDEGARRALEESTWTTLSESSEPLQVGRDDRALGQRAEDARDDLMARVASMDPRVAAWLNGLNAWQRQLLATDAGVWQRWLRAVRVTTATTPAREAQAEDGVEV
jgi:hypothetical protein